MGKDLQGSAVTQTLLGHGGLTIHCTLEV